jgi:hypothetical protein
MLTTTKAPRRLGYTVGKYNPRLCSFDPLAWLIADSQKPSYAFMRHASGDCPRAWTAGGVSELSTSMIDDAAAGVEIWFFFIGWLMTALIRNDKRYCCDA